MDQDQIDLDELDDVKNLDIRQFKWVIAEHGGHERHVELVDKMLNAETFVLWDRKSALQDTRIEE